MTQTSTPSQALAELAQAAGIAVHWRNAQGEPRTVSPDTLIALLAALGLPAGNDEQVRDSLVQVSQRAPEGALLVGRAGTPLMVSGSAGHWTLTAEDGGVLAQGEASERAGDGRVQLTLPACPGYHQLAIGNSTWRIAIAPERAPSVADLVGRPGARIWGPVAQLYSLRRATHEKAARANGFGDFLALAELASRAAAEGADALAISPVHAMFAANPGAYSPYGPSSRLFLNAAYADPAELVGESAVEAAIERLGYAQDILALDEQPLIDWPGANRLRYAVMRELFDDAYRQGTPDWHEAFERFVAAGGQTLQRHARFEALHHEHVRRTGTFDGWRAWPAPWQDPDSEAVEQFARDHAHEIRFHAFGQFLADRGLARAQAAAKQAGMRIGLIADLAVGTDPGGSHAWSRQHDLLNGVASGAPPDIYNTLGQGWGLTAFSPVGLRQNGYAAFIEMLRAVLAHAGGIRIDHVLGLARTWLVPDGSKPSAGAYLSFPLDDMLNLIALEAWRHDAIVIGENLGTVPDGFNATIAETGMLGMNVLFFERDYSSGERVPPFVSASRWPADYLATSTTHDLPTLAGWWAGRDLDWKMTLDRLSEDQDEQSLRDERQADRQAMREALAGLPDASPASSHSDDAPVADMLRWTCIGPQPLALIPLEDLLHLVEQPNIPGTIDGHPNWRRRLPVTTEDLFDQPETRAAVAAINSVRSRS